MSAAVPPVAGLVGLVLASLGALHAAWALGSPWPARDRDALALLVVGTRSVGTMPGRGPTVVVAVLLVKAALLVWAAGGLVPGVPLARVGATGVVRLYSPLCLTLAAGVAWVVWAGGGI